MLKQVLSKIKNKDPNLNVLAIIPFGSTVYKNKIASDFDFVVIVDGFIDLNLHDEQNVDINILGKENFLLEYQKHSVKIMEFIFTPFDLENYYITEAFKNEITYLRELPLDLSKIRESFSKTTSNSYVKAKKKIIVKQDYDYMTSLKSLWHSIRIAEFGIQIIQSKKIDFQSLNDLYSEIEKDYLSFLNDDKLIMWSDINNKYKPIFNNTHSRIKILCPKK